MAEIIIKTDGTLENTSLSLDGKDITASENVVNINVYGRATYVSKYSGDTIPGNIGVSYDTVTKDGKMESHSYFSSDTNFGPGIGKTTTDSVKNVKVEDKVVRFIGKNADENIKEIVQVIIDYCDKNKITSLSKEVLLNRSYESLMDKVSDLGITLE